MATIKKISFSNSNTVGMIVRGKIAPAHHPGKMEQHADCILSNGAPIGFFGEGDGDSSNKIGMSMKGVVYTHQEFARKRAPYVNLKIAQATRSISTVLLIEVTPTEAKAFDKAWEDLKMKPAAFHILGGNCSTRASSTFITAGILKKGIPGLDTPDSLYAQLIEKRKCTSISGYIGFSATTKGGYELSYESYALSYVPHPDQSSFASSL